jgi:hypothetical protein
MRPLIALAVVAGGCHIVAGLDEPAGSEAAATTSASVGGSTSSSSSSAAGGGCSDDSGAPLVNGSFECWSGGHPLAWSKHDDVGWIEQSDQSAPAESFLKLGLRALHVEAVLIWQRVELGSAQRIAYQAGCLIETGTGAPQGATQICVRKHFAGGAESRGCSASMSIQSDWALQEVDGPAEIVEALTFEVVGLDIPIESPLGVDHCYISLTR